MPHFTIEYSANLDGRLDMAKVVELVRKAAAVGAVRLSRHAVAARRRP
jgi:5-carboxymethyl-2-hydroxymuconate isomerase